MMLDGHKFKQINDTYGHDAGDEVIKEMARRLQGCVGQTDTVARLGGDEMGIILPGIASMEAAENVAKQILRSFEKPLSFNHNEISIGAGIGIALYPDDSVNKRQLIKCADQALYKAKESDGSNYKIYNFSGGI
ncbi:MAG TPA: GGDEF domain-containing protein [Chondromyces sp.]|nr:GGDEF domain-containing protein [Chondromyces sp.]